ncbi:glycosyltransferase [Pedobacter sp. Leaf176]|uniref:glycosyltransferase n=1 Tax=Pedobacter sp. Leaf176 TaxID=1736286 RepID=UPI000701AD26|nr:glycosyltransferase [Pedobacter sp. Leaf176]KQR72137.1 hypothetical protein ASF92_02200 [Pedobacter sp. Leaf176]
MGIEKEFDLTASIVLYHSNPKEIEQVIACFFLTTLSVKLYLIDNSLTNELKKLAIDDRIEYVYLGKNVGYGAAHNVALQYSKLVSPYHIILNPDISFDARVLPTALKYMELHEDVGLLSPSIFYPDGSAQLMCRMLPTPFDLIIRRFLPGVFKPVFQKSMDQYLMKDLDYTRTHNIPNLPGSFMFLRNRAIEEVGGFDENFFMYLEDVDLTRRIHQKYKTLYFPEIQIVHALEQGSYKSKKLLQYHIQSAFYYFRKWGWFFDQERSLINRILKKSVQQ